MAEPVGEQAAPSMGLFGRRGGHWIDEYRCDIARASWAVQCAFVARMTSSFRYTSLVARRG
jgi:hypothetical protein